MTSSEHAGPPRPPLHVAFDADDTLWHNESIFALTQERFRDLLQAHAPEAHLMSRLLATEKRNLRLFGYGIKGFTLSMIETAIEVSEGRIPARDIQTIIEWGKWMLEHPVELLPHVREVVEKLAATRPLMLVTKGDLFDQESKLARSGVAHLFDAVEIVSEKDETTWQRLLERHHISPDRFVMIGNSLPSDILPVVSVGGHGVHVPYSVTWAHEHADMPEGYPDRAHRLESLGDLPALLAQIQES